MQVHTYEVILKIILQSETTDEIRDDAKRRWDAHHDRKRTGRYFDFFGMYIDEFPLLGREDLSFEEIITNYVDQTLEIGQDPFWLADAAKNGCRAYGEVIKVQLKSPFRKNSIELLEEMHKIFLKVQMPGNTEIGIQDFVELEAKLAREQRKSDLYLIGN